MDELHFLMKLIKQGYILINFHRYRIKYVSNLYSINELNQMGKHILKIYKKLNRYNPYYLKDKEL